jgi:hypothetical protein
MVRHSKDTNAHGRKVCVRAPARGGVRSARSAAQPHCGRLGPRKKDELDIRTLRKASPAWVIPERFALFATRQGVAGAESVRNCGTDARFNQGTSVTCPSFFLIGELHRRDCRLQSHPFHAKLCLSASPFRPLEAIIGTTMCRNYSKSKFIPSSKKSPDRNPQIPPRDHLLRFILACVSLSLFR